uniref:Acetylserotonin O-methyltransferase-like n=1 Tax=Sinocyclocheilus grahami TaxID=75366 RepID=A0A672PRN6_SINGR
MLLNPVISRLSGKLVVLASTSPRRLEILSKVVPSWFKETLDKSLFKNPCDYAVETAKQKALEVKHLKTPDIVIGADTVVTVDGLILEKPTDKQDAYRMLSRLSGKEHSVFTGVAIVFFHDKSATDYKVIDFYEETKVKFAELSEEMLWEYINRDFLNVVGFPLNHFCKQLGWIFNSPPERQPRDSDAYYTKDEVKIRFMDAMHSIARLTGKDVATAFDLSPYNMACDNGGCTGAMAYEFTKAHPGLSVIVFDLPQVIEVRRHFQPKENDDRVSFVGGFFKDDLPKADLYILARILHDWSDEKLNVLLSKLSKMCTPGCGLLVSEIFLDEERKRPSRALLQALSMTEGKQRSTTEYRDLLEKHGVTPKHIKHTDNLPRLPQEDPNDKRTLLGCSSASTETAELE